MTTPAALRGLDYSNGRPRMAEVKRAGFAFVMRYLSWSGNPKNLTAHELADARTHGIGVGLVFETYEHRASAGHSAGMADGLAALVQAKECGFTDEELSTFPIYFAVDYDAQPADYAEVKNYFLGAASVLNTVSPHIGVYGSYYVCQMLLDASAVTHCWQTMAWSGGNWDSRFHIIQRIGYVTVDGITCDLNDLNDTLPEWGIYGIGEDMPSAAEIAAAIWAHPVDVPRRNDDFPGGVEIVKVPAGDVLAANHAQIFWGLGYNRELWGPGLSVQANATMAALGHVITPEQLDSAVQKAKADVVGVDVTVHRPGQDNGGPAPTSGTSIQ